MNVLQISQCSGRALPRSRRVLDQFAERVGDRTWQTTITAAGLKTLRKLLRGQARKNTAIACHWIRGGAKTEVIWVVGNARRFGAGGTVPTNWTERPTMAGHGEDEWNGLQDIQLLAAIAGLFHDFGKANHLFQRKLRLNAKTAEPYRHEWVSLCLFVAFVRLDNPGVDDSSWLARLESCHAGEGAKLTERVVADGEHFLNGQPLKNLSPVATAVAWMIVTHHRLPGRGPRDDHGLHQPSKQMRKVLRYINSHWNQPPPEKSTKSDYSDCWRFDRGLPFSSRAWCRRANRFAKWMRQRLPIDELPDAFKLHVGRMALIVADHYYSNLDGLARQSDKSMSLYANTDRATGACKQKLDDHLIGVGLNTARVARSLVRIREDLPRLARHPGFRKRSSDAKYRWQDKAYDLSCSVRDQSLRHGFFGVNMASTGTGKTFANARIMYGLADPIAGARFTIAIGLRVLTLQTGQAFRDLLNLDSDVLAVRAGDAAVRTLFDLAQSEAADSESPVVGSESAASFTDDSSYVHYDGAMDDGPLSRWLGRDLVARALVSAPILACTTDHMIRATEVTRGGRHIPAMLRLLTADLVLDEPDDFGMGDLPALSRMVHWAGMLGSRVLLSSATLPPAMLRGLFDAYKEGRAIFQRNVGIPGLPINVPCAWFDEFGCSSEDHCDAVSFIGYHEQFVDKRIRELRESTPKRIVDIVKPEVATARNRSEAGVSIARQLPGWIDRLHDEHHGSCPTTGKRVSFGLVRMANIQPLVAVAKQLFSQDPGLDRQYWICPYHSQHPLIVRAAIERTLDSVLDRHEAASPSLEHPEIASCLLDSDAVDHVFIVLATPVAEVGRDHDYDWAVVEPSSVRSLIQLGGRVLRHRSAKPARPNISLLDTNLRSIYAPQHPSYVRPGFEEKHEPFRLESKSVSDLLLPEQINPLDAAPRLRERDPLDPSRNLADLEHGRLRRLFMESGWSVDVPAPAWWQTPAHLTSELQLRQRFRKSSLKSVRYLLQPSEDMDELEFCRVEKDGSRTEVNGKFTETMMSTHPRSRPFAVPSYLKELERLGEVLDQDVSKLVDGFGYFDTEERADEMTQWLYSEVLGFWRPD